MGSQLEELVKKVKKEGVRIKARPINLGVS
jgi:hypothetical protein